MSQLIEHLYLFDEIFESFLSHISFAKLLYGYFSAKPARLEHITISTSADKIRLCVNLKLFKVNIEVESVFLEGIY